MNTTTYSLTPEDRNRIQSWATKHPDPIKLQCIPSPHDLDADFKAFAREFSRLAPQVTLAPLSSEAHPGFQLSPNIRYTALPLGKELGPFLKALVPQLSPEQAMETPANGRPSPLGAPSSLELFIALECPHCPAMVDTLIPLAQKHPQIHLEIIDGSLFPERAQAQNIMSAPCLILDQDFRWTGGVGAEEILAMIQNRNPANLSAQSLKNILEQGDAPWVAQAMADEKKIFPAFIELLLHETWSVRLGAMVVVETLGETAPNLLMDICPPLMAAFDTADLPLRGDILYALGEAGNMEIYTWIQDQIPGLEHADLMDAATEALEGIKERWEPPCT